jgi:polyphosphate kinase
VEIIFPVLDPALQREVRHILQVELEDNTKAHLLTEDGTYVKQDKRGKVLVNSQLRFCEEAKAANPKTENVFQNRVFIPAEPIKDGESE